MIEVGCRLVESAHHPMDGAALETGVDMAGIQREGAIKVGKRGAEGIAVLMDQSAPVVGPRGTAPRHDRPVEIGKRVLYPAFLEMARGVVDQISLILAIGHGSKAFPRALVKD